MPAELAKILTRIWSKIGTKNPAQNTDKICPVSDLFEEITADECGEGELGGVVGHHVLAHGPVVVVNVLPELELPP